MKKHNHNSIIEVCRRVLQSSPFVEVRGLDCEFQGAVLVIRGAVPSSYTRQIVISMLRQVDGVTTIDNQITVNK